MLSGEVNKLIEISLSGNRAEELRALEAEDKAQSIKRTNRWATILRLIAVAFMFLIGSVSVCVYLLDGASGGNGDQLFGVAFGVLIALWLGLATALRKDFAWLGTAFLASGKEN